MMHILEGVAAGAVLEEARICEVGAADWVELADVAYTRHGPSRGNLAMPRLDDAVVTGAASEEPTATPAAEAPDSENLFAQPAEPEGDPVWAAEFEDALAALESEALESTEDAEPIDRTDFPEPELQGLPDTWNANATPAAAAPAPAPEPTFEAAPSSMFDAAFDAALDAVGGSSGMPQAATPPSHDDGPQWVEHTPREPQPAFIEPPLHPQREEMPIEDTIVVGTPRSEASPEFALQMEHAGEEAPVEATEAPARRLPVPIPVLVAVALAALGGVYVLASGKLGPVKSPPRPAATASAPATDDPVRDGWAALNNGRNDQALQLLTGAVEAQPDNAHAHHGLGLAALAGGKLDVASAHLEKAIELSPKEAVLHVDLGRVRLREARYELAIEEAQRAQALDATDVSALLVLGRAHAGAKRPNEAVKALAAFVDASPKNVEARRDLALALADAGRAGPAAEALGPYLDAHPQDRDMQQQRLDWMLAIGQDAAAAKLYPMDDKKSAFAQYLAGAARIGSDDAVACLDRAVELDPNLRDAWVRRADAYAAVGRPKDAAESMQRAFALAPGSGAEKKLLAQWAAAVGSKPVVAVAKPEPRTPEPTPTPPAVAAAQTEPTQAAATSAPTALPTLDTPPVAKPAAPAAAVTLADRVEDIRRALGRADFTGARRTVEAGRAELRDAESMRNLALWNAIVDFESGDLAAAQTGLESLDATASYVGFGKGAAANWLGRVLLVRGQARAAIGAFDQVPAEDPNEYAAAQLWEGVAMSALGMQDLATRTWGRVREDVGGRVGPSGKAWVQSADFLTGAIAEKDYRTALSSSPEFENDMYFFLGWASRSDAGTAKAHFQEAMQASRGKEFPYHLAEAQVAGAGLAK